MNGIKHTEGFKGSDRRLARLVFFTFVLTFVATRVIVYAIMSHKLPDLFLYIGGTHVHHLNYGIFLLCGVGAYLLFARPAGVRLRIAAALYAIGLALTFDEFGMCGRQLLAAGQLRRDSRDCGDTRLFRLLSVPVGPAPVALAASGHCFGGRRGVFLHIGRVLSGNRQEA